MIIVPTPIIDITDKITAANAILQLLESLLLVGAVDECIMYLPTSNLNCSGNGETPDNTNIEISLIYNSTCPPGFKEISVNESFPVCLQWKMGICT
jgi:hypothetical protein